jgi:hypothetical protein
MEKILVSATSNNNTLNDNTKNVTKRKVTGVMLQPKLTRKFISYIRFSEINKKLVVDMILNTI